jgi:enoyl-CoA hydratase/carnithine racemase
MSLIQSEPHGNVILLRMENGATNPVNPQLVEELSEAVQAAAADYRGLVLAGGQKFFSIGFDLPFLLELDRVGMTDFFNRFNKLVYDIYTLTIPTLAALGGHTIAGGSIIALAADYRFAAQGKKLMGLNEIKLGIPVPYLADIILRQVAGDRVATEMIFGGEFMPMAEARDAGVVDDLFVPDALEDQALLKIEDIAAFDAAAFAAAKANRVEDVQLKYEANYEDRNRSFIDLWFRTEVQEKMKRAAQQF